MSEITFALPDGVIEQIVQRAAEIVLARVAEDRDGWIGVPEAAEHLGCERHRIYDLVRSKRVRFARDGTRLLFRRSDLNAYVEGRYDSRGL